MPHVRLMSGGAGSDRAAQIDALLRDHLGTSLLIVPSGPYARRRAARILRQAGRAGILDPPVITFDELVARILKKSHTHPKPLDPLEQHLLLRQAVAQSPAIGKLGAAAESEGILDHLGSVIEQLKQAAVEPQDFRDRTRSRRGPMDEIVAEVYAAYQGALRTSGVVDRPGMYWLARIECEQPARPAGLGNTQRLLLDDFDDFTPSEFGVLKALARHLEDIVFGMNFNADPEHQTLYALPLRTAHNIRREFDPVQTLDPCSEPHPARRSEFIAASLLVRHALPPPPAAQDDVEFTECHTVEHEIESIARRIKHLVRTRQASPHEIAVVWRKTAPIAGPMREIFREFGIPVTGLADRLLGESAIAGFVLRFIEAIQSWSPERVLDVLTAPWFSGPSAEHADVFPILVRAARVRSTPHGWRACLDTLARYLDDPRQLELKRLADHIPQARQACTSLIRAFERLAEQSKKLPRSTPAAAYIESLESLIREWPIAAAIAAMPPGEERALEEAAVPALRHVLGVLAGAQNATAQRHTRGELLRLLRRAWAATPLHTAAPTGGVACLNMEPARYLHVDYVFLAGMTDQRVPAGRALNAIYSEDDRARLSAAGIPLDSAEIHNQREMLLFQRMFLTARRRLFVSWHRLTPEGASAQRSLYLSEVLDRFPGMPIQKAVSARDVLVPQSEFAGCVRDVQNMAAQAHPARFPEITAAAALERRRYSTARFDAHDGALEAPENLAWLLDRFGPAHVFSASQLEAYADCPFRFFQERVLELFAIEPPEQAFDHLARGSVLHAALERFHRIYLGRTLGEIPPDEATAAMRDCAGAAFDAVAARFRNLSSGVLAAERARTIATLERHLHQQYAAEGKDETAWKPIHIEMEFGGNPDAPVYRLDTALGPVQLQGKIDRVDEAGEAFRLIDYKSSKIEPKRIENRKVFQLALYALAAEDLILAGRTCAEARYVGVGKKNATTVALSRTHPKIPWADRVDLARTAVEQAVDGIRRGQFHPAPEEKPCTGCLHQKVCRFERARIHRKTTP